MLRKKKIMLMTELAMYEKREGRNMAKASKNFRSDYISWHIIKTVMAVTVSYVLIAIMWFIYNSEVIMQNIMTVNYVAIIEYAITSYVIVVLAYGIIAYIVYSVKYGKAAKSLEVYEKGLRQLAGICVKERSNDTDSSEIADDEACSLENE